MLQYVLTIIKNNMLDGVYIFDSQENAINSAFEFCIANMVNIQNYEQNFDTKFNGWVISEDYGYFISVSIRPVLSTTTIIKSNQSFLDKIYGKSFHSIYIDDTFTYNYPSIYPAQPITKIPHIDDELQYPTDFINDIVIDSLKEDKRINPPIIKPMDHPYDINLPGGFDLNDKPIMISFIYSNPYDFKLIDDLSKEQIKALVIARLNHRPYFKFNYQNNPFNYELKEINSLEAIEEIKNNTHTGYKIIDSEIELLYRIYDEALEEESSSEEESDDD